MSAPTIRRGIKELKEGKKKSTDKVRNSGGGRKKISDEFPDIIKIIEEIVEPDVRGDPETPLRWTCKSVRNIRDLLEKKGFEVSHQIVASILNDLDFSLQANKKTKEGNSHPDRNRQFKLIN